MRRTFWILILLAVMEAGMQENKEVTSGEAFTQEQIEELQAEVTIVTDKECAMVTERKEVAF